MWPIGCTIVVGASTGGRASAERWSASADLVYADPPNFGELRTRYACMAVSQIQPVAIGWNDGRVFPIDRVQDYRPASANGIHFPADCFTVVIHGLQRHLYFDRRQIHRRDSVGKWFVEIPAAG